MVKSSDTKVYGAKCLAISQIYQSAHLPVEA